MREAANNQEINQQFGRGYECMFKCLRQQGRTPCSLAVEWNRCKNNVHNRCCYVVMMISNFVEFIEQKRTEKEPKKRSRGRPRLSGAEGEEAA